MATIETCGSTLDTSLGFRTTDCETGAELACNNNTTACSCGGGSDCGSKITPTVASGTTYYIIVDGVCPTLSGLFGYGPGCQDAFTLTVTPP